MLKQQITRAQLNEMLKEAIMQVEDAGVEPSSNILPEVRVYKAKSYFGQCRHRKKEGVYQITISEYHLSNPIDAVMQTLIHEVLHTVKGAMNHGEVWKRGVDKVNRYHGYNISRCGSQKNGHSLNYKAAERNIRYVIECDSCDNIWKRVKKSKLVTNTNSYNCKCGGTLVRTK